MEKSMKINNKIIGLSLVVAASLLTGCVKDTLFDEPTPVSEKSQLKTIYSSITEIEVVLAKDTAQEEFDKTVIETLGNKQKLSSNDLGNLFSTVGKTTVMSYVTILSLNNQPFEYTKPVAGYPILKTVNGENKAALENNGYYSKITINSVGENKFDIKSRLTKMNHLQKRNFEYQGVINQYETYPIYVSKEENNTYKIVLIQVQKLKEKKK
jgi:hypothetical protein